LTTAEAREKILPFIRALESDYLSGWCVSYGLNYTSSVGSNETNAAASAELEEEQGFVSGDNKSGRNQTDGLNSTGCASSYGCEPNNVRKAGVDEDPTTRQ
jgi:hypothetical protein